jgi:hypothetical protein
MNNDIKTLEEAYEQIRNENSEPVIGKPDISFIGGKAPCGCKLRISVRPDAMEEQTAFLWLCDKHKTGTEDSTIERNYKQGHGDVLGRGSDFMQA